MGGDTCLLQGDGYPTLAVSLIQNRSFSSRVQMLLKAIKPIPPSFESNHPYPQVIKEEGLPRLKEDDFSDVATKSETTSNNEFAKMEVIKHDIMEIEENPLEFYQAGPSSLNIVKPLKKPKMADPEIPQKVKINGAHYCIVVGCTNNNKAHKGKVKFYCFPRNEPQRDAWVRAMKRVENPDGTPWAPKPHTRLCSSHFVTGQKSSDPDHPTIAQQSSLPPDMSRQRQGGI